MTKSMRQLECFRLKNSKKDQVEDILLAFKANKIKKSQGGNPRSER